MGLAASPAAVLVLISIYSVLLALQKGLQEGSRKTDNP
jgi:hypothetical protein